MAEPLGSAHTVRLSSVGDAQRVGSGPSLRRSVQQAAVLRYQFACPEDCPRPPQRVDISAWVTVHYQEVGLPPLLERAGLLPDPQHIGSLAGGRVDRRHGAEAKLLDIECDLAGQPVER